MDGLNTWTVRVESGRHFIVELKESPFDTLLGKTLLAIEGANFESDYILFTCTDGEQFLMYHDQDCCEWVRVEEIHGDISALIGSPITMAEVETNDDHDEATWNSAGTCTWTFYKLATAKGYVTIRWLGESNGYYSEEVSFAKVVRAY